METKTACIGDYVRGVGSLLNIMPANVPVTFARRAAMDESAQMAAAWNQTGDDLRQACTEYAHGQSRR